MQEMQLFYKCQKCQKHFVVEVDTKKCLNPECNGDMKFAFIGFVEAQEEGEK